MKLIGFRDFDWTSFGYRANIPQDSKPYITVAPTVLYRAGAPPAFGPSQLAERTIPCEFSYNGTHVSSYEEAWNWLMQRINVYDTRPAQLRAQRLDGTIVALDAILTLPNSSVFGDVGDVTTLPAIFVTGDPFWTALTEATATKTFTTALDMALSIPIQSALAEEPIVTIKPTAQRAAGTSLVGWTKRQVIKITNNASRALVNVPYAIDLGNTATLVAAGKARADGNDLRIIRDGREVSRTLAGWNSASSRAWINIANLAAGDNFNLELWYGNASAGAATSPTGTDAAALDPATSTNLVWKYLVDSLAGNAGLGGWYLSSGTQVPTISNDTPAAWRFVMTKESVDDTWQEQYTSYVATGTKYHGIFKTRRARTASLVAGDSDTDADGVMLYHPAGISNVKCDLLWLNQYLKLAAGDPVGRLVILSSQDGITWNRAFTNNTLQTTEVTIATTDYPISPAAPYVAFAVWPFSGNEVPTTGTAGRVASAAWKTTLEVTVGGASIAQSTVQAEEDIYELATEIRLGGDSTLDAPYRAIRLGGTAGRRYAVRLNENVRIDLGDRKAQVWDAAGTTLVGDVPVYAIQAIERISATAGEQTAGRWLDMQPYMNPLGNPSFTANLTGWSRQATAAGVTAAAQARDTATFKTTPASLKTQITASTAGSGVDAVQEIATDFLPIGGRSRVWVAGDQRTDNVNLQPALTIWFYNAAQGLISYDRAADWVPVANTWYRQVHSAAPPLGAAYYRVGTTVRTKSANQTGSNWLDDVSPTGLDLILTDTAIGSITVTVGWLAQYL